MSEIKKIYGHNSVIIRNTIFLYLRMVVIMIIKLYTTRILLEVLGVDNYGIWNLVYGAVIAFTFINSSITTATQRFLNYDQGIGGANQTQIFSSSFILTLSIALLLVIILETIGSWLVMNKLEFPDASSPSVLIVFHCCVLILFLNFLRLPFEAIIVSHEKFSFYAFISFVDAILSLGVILILKYWHVVDSLSLYGYLSLSVSLFLFLIYFSYCKKRFKCVKINFHIEKKLFVKIGKFSGWNFFGSMASMASTQGINVLLNMFYGVSINAAYGISTQMRSAFSLMSDNILKAANPRIVKLYAQKEIDEMMMIVLNISKISFLLIFFFGFIIMNFIDLILSIWIGIAVPGYAGIFCNLLIIQILIICLASPIDTVIFSTGDITKYQITISCVLLLNLILSYILLYLGFLPTAVLIVKCFVELLVLAVRLYFLKLKIGYSIRNYLKDIIIPPLSLVLSSYVVMSLANYFLSFEQTIVDLIEFSVIYIPFIGIVSWFVYINDSQRDIIRRKLHMVLFK